MLLLVQTFSTSYLLFCTALLIFQGIQNVSADEDYLEKCCGLGSSWAAQKLRCERFTGPVVGVPREEQSGCLEAVQICCKKSFQDQRCNQGKIEAKAGVACVNLDTGSKRLPIGLGDFQRDCCEACKLGILHGSSGNGCVLQKFSLGIPWDPAFMECCTEALLTTIRDASSTSNTTRIDRPISNITTLEDNGIDDQSNKNDITDTNYSTFNLDDLCKLMKGLLCSEICIPTPGSYYCKCHEGSTLQEDGRTCKSNGTETLSSKLNASFHNIFQPINGSISPVTILKTLPRTTRSLSAEDNDLQCPSGYRFNTSIRTCDDIDECAEEPKVTCHLGSVCLNTIGSYQCVETARDVVISDERCEIGYRWNSTFKRCTDVDECLENIHKCVPEIENCRNLEGSYECEIKCARGFVFNGNHGACLDINECTELTNVCLQPDTICVNTLGSYECKSIHDYQQVDNPSHLTNGSDSRRPSDYEPTDNENVDDGGRETICAFGFKYDSDLNRCDDIDECVVHREPCAPGEICRNTIGGYDCIPAGCPRGFELINDNCQDLDECQQNLHSCAPHERCQNTNGSFTCEQPRPTRRPTTTEAPRIICRKGYKADIELRTCVDIDECLEGPGCRDHEKCRNLEGSYDCLPLCGPGWFFHINTKTCQDVDECLLGHHNCRQRTQFCRNIKGSYVCEPLNTCASGYRRTQNGSCVDIDECLESLHSCSRESHRYCVNRDGGYECITRLPSCARGYEYSLLTRQCEDIDECRTGRADCDTRQNKRCVNLPGGYRCELPMPVIKRPACPSGYSYDVALRRCSDIDECAEGSHTCGSEKCYNLPGSFQCAKAPLPVTKRKPSTTPKATVRSTPSNSCNVGSRFDNTRGGCIDINECEELEEACSYNEKCINTPGSFRCECRTGFRREELTRACVDINECQLENDCQSTQRCDNTIGSYTCVRFLSCGTGYTLNAATEICEDDNECLLGTHDCQPGFYCRNTLGSFRCDRPRGNATTVRPTTRRTIKPTFSSTIAAYTTARSATTSMNNPITTATPRSTTTLKPTTRMTSSERPSTRTPKITTSSTARSPTTTKKATTTTEQVPTVGALTTTTTTQRAKTTIVFRPRYNCPRGFESGPLGECVDIDECQRNLKICGAQRCVNLLGSFKCIPQVICGIGFAYDPLSSTCKDIDECAQGTHKCGADQTCENKQGGYICYCPPGYEIDAEHNCVDIDECTRVQPGQICGINNKCINTPGSYRCLCGPGFENDATGICRDIDECKRKSGLCQQQCYNTWGGHRCGCQSGYRLKSDNRTCEDVDECNEFRENNLCVGICDNTPGSYICRCPDGYKLSGDGRTCLDIDECAIGNVCKAESELCQNVGGGFRCNKINCPSGYIRDLQRKNRCMRESQLCPLHDEACFQRPAHYTYNYIGIVSMYPIPTTTGQVELFTMRGAYIHPGSTVRFTMSFIQARAPPHVQPATESCFALRKPYPHQAVLVLTKSLQGPQDIELEFSMEIYGSSGEFAGSAVAKIFIVVTQYEF